MIEWFEGRSVDERGMERRYWLRVGTLLAIAVALVMIFWPMQASADPLFQAKTPEGVVITIHNDKCALPEVENLPTRITWDEKGKITEGCYGIKHGIVIFYFADKTVGIIPAQIFERVIGV